MLTFLLPFLAGVFFFALALAGAFFLDDAAFLLGVFLEGVYIINDNMDGDDGWTIQVQVQVQIQIQMAYS